MRDKQNRMYRSLTLQALITTDRGARDRNPAYAYAQMGRGYILSDEFDYTMPIVQLIREIGVMLFERWVPVD